MTTCDCQNHSGKANACTCGASCTCDGCSCKTAPVSQVENAPKSCCGGRKEGSSTCNCQQSTDKAAVCTCDDKCSCECCNCGQASVDKVKEAPNSCCSGRVDEETKA